MSSNRKPVEALAGSVRRIRDELEANAATSPKSSPDADADAATSDPGTYPPSQDARPPPADSTNGAHDASASLLAPVNIGARLGPSLTDGAEAAAEGAPGTAQAADAGPDIVRRRGREPGSMENLDAGPTRTPPPERSGDVAGGADGGAPVLAPNQKPQLKPKPKPKLQPIRALSTIAAELIREASQPGLGRGPEPGPGTETSDNRKSTKLDGSSDKPTSASKSGYQRTTSKVSTSSKSGPEPEVPLLPPPPSRVEQQQQQQQRKQSANKKTITESDIMPIDVEPGPQVRGPTRPPKPPEKRLLKQRPQEPEPANDEQNNLNVQQQHVSGENAGPLEGQEASPANTQVELLESGKPKRRMSIANHSDFLYQFSNL